MMVKTAVTGSRGQIVIPAEYRRQVGLKAGQRVTVVVDGDTIVIKPIPNDLVRALHGCLRDGPSLTAALSRDHAEELQRDEERGV